MRYFNIIIQNYTYQIPNYPIEYQTRNAWQFPNLRKLSAHIYLGPNLTPNEVNYKLAQQYNYDHYLLFIH